MPDLENAPVPPTQFSAPQMRVRLAVGQDALGNALIRDQANFIYDEFRRDDAARTLHYWDDMREFYGIQEEDEASLPLTQVAIKYQFTDENRTYAESKSDHLIVIERDDASYWASSTSHEYQAERMPQDIEALRRDLRKQAVAEPHRKVILEQYLNDPTTALPPLFRDMRDASSTEPISWHDWLTDEATPEQFLNFVQWNNYHVKQLNEDPAVEAAIAEQKEEYATVLKDFVADGSIPIHEYALEERLREAEYLKVHIGDVFSTVMRDWGGYYPFQANASIRYVIVDINHIKHATKHEMNHAVLGSFLDRWLDEATTEHIAVAMRRGKMEPVGDIVAEGVYNEERLLLDTLMTEGAAVIPLTTLLKGYTEPNYRLSKDTFETAVERSWGPNALRMIEEGLQTREKMFMTKGLSEREAQEAALRTVRSLLVNKPERIFGVDWVKPIRAES